MFETSRDILNISVSVSVVVLVIFLCVALYYLIANLKRINKISQQIEGGVDKINNLVDLIKSKIKQSSSYLFLLSNLIDKAVDFFNKKKENRQEERFKEDSENSNNNKTKFKKKNTKNKQK